MLRPSLLVTALASFLGTVTMALADEEPFAKIAVLSNPYVTTLPAAKIVDERGSNRGWLARLARPSMEQSVALIRQIKPDAVVILGSLTWSGSDADLDAFAETIESVDVPVFLTPGLRDTPDGEFGGYLKRFAEQNVAQSVKSVKGVRLLFAQDLGRLAGLDNAVERMEAQLATDGPAKAVLLFGGRAHPHGPGELDPESERFWQFVETHKIAARLEPCRYGSRVEYPRTLPVFLVGSTAWSLRGAVTLVRVYPDRVRVELVGDVAQPSYGVEVPNPVAAARLEPAAAYPHGSPSYAADLATKPNLTFAVVSDPQLSVGRRRKYLVGTTQKAIGDLNRLSPAAVFVTGDLVEDNLPDDWKLFNETFATLRPACHIMPGNHDVMFSHTFVEKQYATAAERKPEQARIVTQAAAAAAEEGVTGPTALYEKHTGRKPHYTVAKGDCVFICLPILTQKIDAEEIEWLRRQLEETKDAKHVFVLGHYPVLPAFGNNVQPDLGGNAVLSLLREHRVAAFIFGHRHRKGFRMHDGTAHVLCDNMKSIHLFHVFDDRIVIGRKDVGAALYEKLTIPEPRSASRQKPPPRGAAVRRYIEAEACDGLLRYPYHNEAAAGWYAREANCRAYGAPGRTYCAAIHENAKRRTMAQTLAVPVPAGNYRVFLRTVGPRSADRDTIVEVGLGRTPVAFRWPKGGKRFVWLPGVDVALSEPADAVSFAAKQFGGNGHGGLYEPMHRSIWVDTLYITSDLTESAPPDLATERGIRAGVSADDLGERPAYRADDYGPADQRTPEPDGPVMDDPIRLESFDGRRNLWPNASFELGMNDGWATSARGVKHVFTDRDLDRESPLHGRYSLRLPPGVRSLSRPYYLPTPGTMTLSLYLRGDGGKATVSLLKVEGDYKARPVYDRTVVKVRPVLTMAGTSSEQWQRLSATGEVPEGWYYLRLSSSEGLLLDAIQLEAGPQSTAFAPRAELEGALRTGQLGNITYEDQDTLTAWFHNSADTVKRARLRYRIVDMRERVVAEGLTGAVQVGAGATVRRELAIVPRSRGVFSITYAIEGRKLPEGETVYLRMPEPAGRPTRHELGGNMSFDPVELALHRRLGLKWALTCKTRIVGAAREAVHRKPDEWQWFDDAAARPKALGMDVEPCFWPGRIPEFMVAKDPKRFRPVRGSYRKCVPDLQKWRDYVTKVADHYRPHITQWCIDDEAECSWDPAQYASVVRTTADAVHENVPGVKVGISAVPEFTEELLCHVPADKIDFLGASTFDFSYWGARRVKRLRERYGKEWHCYGVGSRTANTMYHTLYTYQPVRRRVARMARRVVNLLLAQDLEIAGHYAAVLRNDGAHIPKNRALCDYDGTALPWGGTFGCLGTLLADAESIGDVPLGNTGLRAYVFRVDRRIAAVTWATCVRRYDHHWRPARRQLSGVSLECTKGSVAMLDMFWNEDPRPRWEAGRLSFDLDEEPIFIMDRTLGEAKFVAMLRNADSPVEPVETSAALASDLNGGVDLRLRIRNNTEADLHDVTVDLRNPPGRHPLSTAGEWLLRRPVGTVEHLPAGGTAGLVLPTMVNGTVPFENGQIRVNLKASNGVEAATDHSLWLLPAAAVESAPEIDGQLSEWESRPAAWLAFNWAWALLGRGASQIHEGGEYFSYPPYRVDARAALWAAWDKQNLYVAMRLEDDQPMLGAPHGERIRLLVCPDGGKRIEIELTPTATGEVQATVAGLLARSSALPNAINLEVTIPWQALGSRPRPGSPLGFDLFWTDVDREDADLVAGTLRWAGGSQGTGYLLLRDEELSVRPFDSEKPRRYRSRPEARSGLAQPRRWNMHRIAFAATGFLLAAPAPAMAQLEPVLHVSFDKNFDGVSPKGVVSGTKEERPALVPGKVGQALKSGPGTGYVQFPTRDIINPVEGTVEMWVCPLDWTFSDREFHVFFDVIQGEGLLCLYKFWELASLLMLGSEKSGGPYDYYGFPAAWKPGEWHHIVGTWSAKGSKEAGVQCFIDGKVWRKFPTPAKLPERLGAMFRIGDHPWSAAPRKSSSLVDEVRIYGRALSLAHIAAHYRGDYDYCAPLSVKQMRLSYDFEPEKEAVTAYVDVGYTDVADSRLSVRMAIVVKGAALPDNASGGPVAGGKAKQVLSMPTMAPGEYDVVAQLYQDSAQFTELRTHLSIPDVKQWQGNTIGLEDKVLPPWTPMQLEGETVRCWGREYVFDGSPLLTQVSSGGHELLTRPLALNATIAGQPVRWKAQVSKGKLSSQSTAVRMGGVLTGTARKTSIRLKVASTVEYDGLHLVELSLPGGEAATLDKLSLEIPVRRERALYRQRFLYLWDRDRSSGLLPPGEGVVDQDKFTPYYWLADNDRGLFWFCESDEMWPNGQSSNAVQVVRQGDEVVLRLNLLASGQGLPPDWHFTFGLQATPVKPLPKDWRKWRLTPAVKGNLDIIWPVASRSDSLRYHGYPEAMVPDKPFVNRISHLHKRGVKALPYLFLTWFPDNCPEWPFFREDWGLDGGKREGAYGANIRQISVANKDFQDFVTWKTKEFVEKYGIDGGYHDNTALMPIESIPAGGYVRNGKTYPTYPILSKRRLYRRIYAMYKGLPRETFTIAHTSRSMVIPVLAYEDAILVGEHFRGKVKDNYMDVFSLDTFRAEMMGRQWGVISFFLPELGGNTGGNEAKEVEPTRGMMALLMIHDVPLWPIWCNAEEVNRALAALDEFGYVNADFIGYFDSMPPAKTDMTDVYVSAYKGADKRALLIAANLSREDRKGLVAIDAARMGVPLKEVLSWPGKEPMEVSEGKVEIEIPKLGYRMLLIGDVGVASIPGGN